MASDSQEMLAEDTERSLRLENQTQKTRQGELADAPVARALPKSEVPELLSLSLPHPDFEKNGYKFTDSVLLHYLLATGKGDEVLKRRQELSPSLLSRTCKWGDFYKEMTALHVATKHSSDSVVKVLLHAGSAIEARDSSRRTPLHYATMYNSSSVVKVLI